MERGTIKWFDEEKGYGFILSEIGEKEYFVHRSAIADLEGTLDDGQIVEFEIGQGQKGPTALNVRVLYDTED
jgi:CspA family cold shock protein